MDKENQRNNGLGHEDEDEGRYKDEADALLAKIKSGSLSTGMPLPASSRTQACRQEERSVEGVRAGAARLKERTESLEAMEKSEVLSATRDYLERAKAKAQSDRGGIHAEQLAYYTSWWAT